MKIPKLEGFAYFLLRAASLLIGGATVIYFVCDNSVSYNEHSFMGPVLKDSPLERLIKWKLVGLTVYTGWIYGIVIEEPKFLVFVLILWSFAVLYSLIHLFISFGFLILSLYDNEETVVEHEISSFCSIFLVAAFFIILLSVHWILFKLMQKATIEETECENEGKSLLNKGKPLQVNETNNKELSANP